MLWQNVNLDFEHGALRILCFAFSLLLMKTVTLWKTMMNQVEGYVIFWSTIFQARAEGPRHHLFERFLRYVQKSSWRPAGLSTKMSLTNSWLQKRNPSRS